jgi:zinc resistance-associated protein
MWKAVLAGTTALAIAGSTLVYAQQQRGGRPDGFGRGPNIEDMRAFAEARLAALRAGLTLTPEQERNWPAFEQAAREMQKLRLERMNAFMAERRNPQQRSTDPAERLRRQGTAMAETGDVLKKLADATEPLYQSLDDSQKRRFVVLSRLGVGREGRDGRGFRDDRDGGRQMRGGREDFGRDPRSDRADGGREFRGGREFGGPEFRGRPDFRAGPEFRGGRDGDDRDFRNRGGERPRGYDRAPRRGEGAPDLRQPD